MLELENKIVESTVALQAPAYVRRPHRIGGMATPFGVYLTTGQLTAGAGFWGLYATGLLLTSLNAVIDLAFKGLEHVCSYTPPDVWQALLVFTVFLVTLQLSPLSMIHAAEHQTIHAIERGEPLTLEAIARMPRDHRRCGTNLMGLLFGVELLLPLGMAKPLLAVACAVGLWLTRKWTGRWLQRLFTTKQPGVMQLLDGQRAGLALLEAYTVTPYVPPGRGRRIWNMGMVQVLAGALTVLGFFGVVAMLFPATRGYLT